MTQTTSTRAAKKFGPGYFIQEQMEYRDWTQADLAEITGYSPKHINKILQDKQPLTLEAAQIFGEIFGTSPQYWINLDSAYRLWLLKDRSQEEIDANIRGIIYERMPIKDMLQKGWFNSFQTVQELQNQVLAFWGWDELNFIKIDTSLVPALTRRSEAYNQFNASYAITWYQKAKVEAKKVKVPPYSKSGLERIYNEINTYTTRENGIDLFINELAKVGVVFFVLPHLQKTYLDGAAFLLNTTPVIVYTGRYKRIDNFWFTVAHEIAHILYHLDAENPFVLDNLRESDLNEAELEANSIAAAKLKHQEILDYLNPFTHYLTTQHIELCAQELDIHPAVIIGKLAHEKKVSYKHQNLYNENVLGLIPAKYQII